MVRTVCYSPLCYSSVANCLITCTAVGIHIIRTHPHSNRVKYKNSAQVTSSKLYARIHVVGVIMSGTPISVITHSVTLSVLMMTLKPQGASSLMITASPNCGRGYITWAAVGGHTNILTRDSVSCRSACASNYPGSLESITSNVWQVYKLYTRIMTLYTVGQCRGVGRPRGRRGPAGQPVVTAARPRSWLKLISIITVQGQCHNVIVITDNHAHRALCLKNLSCGGWRCVWVRWALYYRMRPEHCAGVLVIL